MAHQTHVRVRYIETDQGGVVYHANYLAWFEVGRTEYLRELGYPYAAMERDGLVLAVVEAHLSYRAPARYDDLIRVETTFDELRRVRMKIATRILNEETGQLLADGWIWLAALDAEGKVAGFSAAVREVLERGISRKEPA